MIAELLTGLARVNLAAAAAIALVLILRRPARRLFGARAAYGLWIVAPLAALAVLLPARSAPPPIAAPPSPMAAAHMLTGLPVSPGLVAPALAVDQAVSRMTAAPAPAGEPASADPWLLPLNIWLVGVVSSLGLLVWRQRRFLASLGRLSPLVHDGQRLLQAERAGIGPAVVGALFPRVIAPADFATRFTPAEQAIVLAHERAHLARQDARVNGLVALAQCAAWFNPLVQMAAYFIRLDQELACDATVVAARPNERRRYAEALLKTQLGAAALPLGCYWPAQARHPLEERIAMLKLKAPSRARRLAGLAAIALIASAGGLAAWASQPPQDARAQLAQADTVPTLHVSPATATTPAALTTAGPDASGDWIGEFRAPPNLQVAFHIRRGADGAYTGVIDVPQQSTYDLPLGKITVEGDTLTIFDPHIRGTYTARWDATDAQWVGDWRQIDLDIPLTLRRGRFPPAPTVTGLDGAWDGVLPVNGGMRLGLTIATTAERGTQARFDAPDQKAYGILATSIARQGDKVAIGVKAMNGVIDARLSPDGQTLSGVFDLSGTGVALTLARRAPDAPAPYPPAPPRPAAPPPLPPEPPVVSLDGRQLAAYVGRYEIAQGRVFTLTLENGRLFVLRPDQIKLEIFPSSPRDFFSKEVNLQATFPTGDPGGHPPYVVLRENGRYEIGTFEEAKAAG